MAQAVAARREGDTFQARMFWRKAVCLLDPVSPITKVGFEIGPKGFDDIWVEYEPGRSPHDQEGRPLLREHLQCKWHVTPNSYVHADLINPEFINADSQSLLQRAHKAQLAHAPNGFGACFKLVTNWHIDKDDALRPLIRTRNGTLRLNSLFGTFTDKSKAGAIRKIWREHLGITEEQLRVLARTLAFSTVSDSLDDLRESLDWRFAVVGLRRIPANECTFLYDDLVYQWLGQGRLEFDRQSLLESCKQQGLLEKSGSRQLVIGVKSFEHAFDRLEDRCATVLDLIHFFDERPIRRQEDWQTTLYPQLKSFLIDAAKRYERIRLALDAHITLAFAAGSILNIKSGRVVELEQRTIGNQIWSPDDVSNDPTLPTWIFEVESFCENKEEIAVAVCLTHDVAVAVKKFAEKNLPTVGRLLIARLACGAGARAVVSGRHAFELAEKLSFRIKEENKQAGTAIHLFITGPNAFTFFLGQRQPSLGKLTLYEFDFEGHKGGSYEASLSLPVKIL